MIAVIRVRFPNTSASAEWTDEVMNNWLNPNIPFSLAHYWTRTSLFQADMRYYLFPPIVLADPRMNPPPNPDLRQLLVDGVTAEITRLFSPDWNSFDRLFVCFAQKTDLFGGGAYPVPVGDSKKYLPAAVCDNGSPFSDICQEVGHSFGLNHEKDRYSGAEYNSPYSCMSSEGYGGAGSSFERQPNALPAGVKMPVGIAPAKDITQVKTNDVQRIIGPYITPAQFYIHALGSFIDDKTVYHVPPSYATAPEIVNLTAVDAAIDSWPLRKILLAVLPPVLAGDDTYFLELRRNVGYDAGLEGNDNDAMAVVVHSADLKTLRLSYVDSIPLRSPTGDRDYHSFAGNFTVRLNTVAEDLSSCSVIVGGGNFWRYFGVDLADKGTNPKPNGVSDWATADVSPCFMFAKSPHQYRYHFNTTEVVMTAISFGYETPGYQWFLNDLPLDPTQTNIKVKLSVKVPTHGVLGDPQEEDVSVFYVITGSTIKLTFNEKYSGMYVSLKTVVNETSPGVLKNNYPERSVWTGIRADNVVVEWDQGYSDAQRICERRIKDVNDHYSISQSPVPKRGPRPGPDLGEEMVQLVNALVRSNPAAANAAINEIARLGNISKLEVIKQLQ